VIGFIFFFLAAIFNGLMDRVGDTVAFNQSKFRNGNDHFWNKEVSWKYAKKILGWKLDAWHIAKSLMVISLVGASISYRIYGPFLSYLPDFLIFGSLWNIGFNISYHIIFKK
jgi:hypothetical protein